MSMPNFCSLPATQTHLDKFLTFSQENFRVFPEKLFSDFQKVPNSSIHFYLPHMEYEGSIGLVMRKMKKQFFADFHFLGAIMNKKHDLSVKKFSVCHAPLPPLSPLLDEICLDATEVALKARKLKFWQPKSFVST
jgi:hypothetical protein